MIYIFSIILLLIYIIYVYRVDLKYRYEINPNNFISIIQIFIFNKPIYHKESKYPIMKLVDVYIQNNKKEKEKLSHKLAVLKMNLKILIKDISKEKVHINILIGLKEVILTSYLLTYISVVLSKYLTQNIKCKHIKNINYMIKPDYSNYRFVFNSRIKIRIITIILIWLKTKKKGDKENGRTSY